METARLDPILKKESTLKTAGARELQQAPQDVLDRYGTYALTHIPLGDTNRQLTNLKRVITQNKTCAVGTIVGPYGYGKTSTAVHLWNELRQQRILAVPPFLWENLPGLMDGVYHWIRFELAQGPKAFIPQLDHVYESLRQSELEEMRRRLGAEEADELIAKGRLLLDIRPDDVVKFFSQAATVGEEAGYEGMVVFTDELQATLAAYRPSRDQFFADLFAIVKDILGLPGKWAWVISTDDDTEGYIARMRADLLQRLQRSALYFRVRDVYSRREYPAELWAAYEKRFGFEGSAVILPETLDAIGQVAARSDLGAGPRMVTNVLSLGVKHYQKTASAYTPIQFVDDFVAGQVQFDQRGKFAAGVKKALDNTQVRDSGPNQRVVKLLAAYPAGCPESLLDRFELLDAFRAFPPLARRELILSQSGGYSLRYLAESEEPPEQIEQRLTKEFVQRYAPGREYATRAARGFIEHILLDATFSGWKREKPSSLRIGDVEYQGEFLGGSFEPRYPDRHVAVPVAAISQSPAPQWRKLPDDLDAEIRFELNYSLAASEPSRLLVSPTKPNAAVFQLNLNAYDPDLVNKILPSFLQDYYAVEQLTPFLSLALIDHLWKNRGDLPDDQNRVATLIAPLRQYALAVLLNERLECSPADWASTMVGVERIKDLFRHQCRRLYPAYETLIKHKRWTEDLQQYAYAVERVIAEDGVSIVRGRHPWKTTKEGVADAFHIAGRSLTRLEALLNTLDHLIVKEEFGGRLPSSEVSLRFVLHPLEEEWLAKLEQSLETVRREGTEVRATPAGPLIERARSSGYTTAEVMEILRLLQGRKYIDYDQRKGLLARTVDDITDLREAVEKQIDALDQSVQVLTRLPEFKTDFYPVARCRAALAKAQERDEIETLRSDVRKYMSNLSAFAASHMGILKTRFQQEQNDLHEPIRLGVPPWLGQEFAPGPLNSYLEQQRRDVVTAYRAALGQIKQAHDESASNLQAISGLNPDSVMKVYDALIQFTRQAKVLRTRLQSYEDRREDLDGWRRVSDAAADLVSMVRTAQAVYENEAFARQADQLWQSLGGQFETQPLTALGTHREASVLIADLRKSVSGWLEGRREDFERQCKAYEQALASAGIDARLTIPFDQEHPIDSYSALKRTVADLVGQFAGSLGQNMDNLQHVVRYGILVQQLPLAGVETDLHTARQRIAGLEQQIAPDEIGDVARFRDGLLAQLVALSAEVQRLADHVHQAARPRPPEGSELRLMDLLAQAADRQGSDLRGLITRLLDQGEVEVNLEVLMHDLQSLFQKNQIAIHIRRL